MPNKHLFRFFRSPTDLALEENAHDASIAPFVFKFIEGFDEELNDPSLFCQVCRDLFTPTQYKVGRIKWPDQKMPRFERFVETLESGVPGFPESDARKILTVLNQYNGNHDYIEAQDADVAWHFRISSSFSSKGKLLFNAIQSFQPEKVVELGSGYGMSAMFMLLAMKGRGKLWTLERDDPQYSLSKELLTRQFNNVSCVKGTTQESLPGIVKESGPVDFAFHDAGHGKRNYLNDFAMLTLNPGSVVIFDDLHWNDPRFVQSDPKCYKGWRKIVGSDCVRAAVELEVDHGIGIALIK